MRLPPIASLRTGRSRGDEQFEESPEKTVKEEVKFVPREFSLVAEPENHHGVGEDGLPLALYGDEDRREQLHRVYPAYFARIYRLEYVLYRLSLIREYIHLFGGVEPEFDGCGTFACHGHDDLPERFLGPPAAKVREAVRNARVVRVHLQVPKVDLLELGQRHVLRVRVLPLHHVYLYNY